MQVRCTLGLVNGDAKPPVMSYHVILLQVYSFAGSLLPCLERNCACALLAQKPLSATTYAKSRELLEVT